MRLWHCIECGRHISDSDCVCIVLTGNQWAWESECDERCTMSNDVEHAWRLYEAAIRNSNKRPGICDCEWDLVLTWKVDSKTVGDFYRRIKREMAAERA